jgi:hypothetical protein
MSGRAENMIGSANGRQTAGLIFVFIVAFLTFPYIVSGQDDDFDIAPPPLKSITKDEQNRLDAEYDSKNRIKLAMGLMDARLSVAEKLNASENYDAMFTELGHFAGFLDYSLLYLAHQDPNKKGTLDSYKRIEIALRPFITRLEVIRRNLPIRYEQYVRELLKSLRLARTKALEPQFSDTVIPNSSHNSP